MTAINLVLVVALARLTIDLADRSRRVGRDTAGHDTAGRDSAGRGTSDRRRRIALAAGIALLSEPVISTIGYGQVNLLIAVLVLGDLTIGTDSRRGGWATGLAAALKLTPLVFIPYLMLTGRRRMAGRATRGFLAAILLSFIVEPWNALSYWGGALFDTDRVTGGGRFAGRGPADQSLRGAIMRLLPAGSSHVTLIWVAACLLVGLSGLWLARRSARRGNELTGFVLCAIVGLLVCPVTWTHHWVIAVPGLIAIVGSSHRPGRETGRRVVAVAAGLLAAASPAVWLAMGVEPSATHLGALGLILDDLYVLAGLAVMLGAGVVELRHTRAAIRRRRGVRVIPEIRSGRFRVAPARSVIDNPAS